MTKFRNSRVLINNMNSKIVTPNTTYVFYSTTSLLILRDDTGGTLHASAFFGYTEIVKLFLDHQADPNLKDNSNQTALDWARKRGNTDTYKILKESTLCSQTECGKCQDICLLCDGSKSIYCKGEK